MSLPGAGATPSTLPPRTGLLTRGLILLVRLYQMGVSPMLGQHCRFQPTCSVYLVEALTKRGLLKGLWLGLGRILRCHPFSAGGYEPVP